MAEKFIRVGENKAFKVEGILLGENKDPQISVRQMYKTKKDPTWRPGRQGFTIPLAYAANVARAIGQTSQIDPSGFKDLAEEASE